MMMKRLAVLALPVLIAGCAVGNTYDYGGAAVDLPVQGTGNVGLAVVEQRPYVLDGDKQPDFVGLQRGGFGNPFDVTTQSGKPLADAMADAITRELKENGYEVVALEVGDGSLTAVTTAIQGVTLPRSVVLTVREWKTDAYMNFGLSYDLELSVYDEQATRLASTTASGKDEVLGGAGMESGNAKAAAIAFSTKLGRMFNAPEIRQALAPNP
ncbi:hypothetical protein E4634_14145 [Mangrovimicrobium sediminis]|uniref:DUF4410 domain-containing protein n=1 Tax=Mangrovimicrobium sediminis TaxID=2562682 RepID=A0A4Z0LZW9_9GAMM|nr:hypothetical protein [Haliea sp. SAOS-164]TGD72658.1 hypothetical protein E4634_14145 [Haliea sp. SAOS-164]